MEQWKNLEKGFKHKQVPKCVQTMTKKEARRPYDRPVIELELRILGNEYEYNLTAVQKRNERV